MNEPSIYQGHQFISKNLKIPNFRKTILHWSFQLDLYVWRRLQLERIVHAVVFLIISTKINEILINERKMKIFYIRLCNEDSAKRSGNAMIFRLTINARKRTSRVNASIHYQGIYIRVFLKVPIPTLQISAPFVQSEISAFLQLFPSTKRWPNENDHVHMWQEF